MGHRLDDAAHRGAALRVHEGPALRFGVHPTLEDALAAVAEDALPDDLDAILPTQRRMSSMELVAIGRLCAAHVAPRIGPRNRAEFDRLIGLVDRALASPPGTKIPDLGMAARRDAEHARGALKVAALTAWAVTAGGVDAARLVGEAAQLAAKTLARDRDALHAFLRALCAQFR